MNNKLISILKGLLTIFFIVIVAGALASVGFVLLVIGLYYTILLVLNYGVLAGLAAIVGLVVLVLTLTIWIIKHIRKGL